MPSEKQALLTSLSFGQRVAEDEVDALASYFVETEQWRKVVSDEVDVVFGPKGAGKSAIYSTLLQRDGELFDRGVFLISAENPRGTPAFKDLATDPPTSELAFVTVWKLYTLSLIGSILWEWEVPGKEAARVRTVLSAEGLLPPKSAPLVTRVKSTLDFVRRLLRPKTVEGGLAFDASANISGLTGKITLGEPSESERKSGYVSIDELLRLADEALHQTDYELWLLFDRLDVAFADSRMLEANALRALFKCYLDLNALRRVRLKIFLRSDIWRSISAGGFREASHITRQLSISWSSPSLLNLVANRLLQNQDVVQFCETPITDRPNAVNQRELFDSIVPEKIDAGRNPLTFEWILGRVQDGTKTVAPREVIHLLTEARDTQLKMLERGEPEPPDRELFSRQAFRESLQEVSRVRLEQTIYAEYPEVKDDILALEREKTAHSIQSLSAIWRVSVDDVRARAALLVEVGFFEERGEKTDPTYWIPFLYRPALQLVQGTA